MHLSRLDGTLDIDVEESTLSTDAGVSLERVTETLARDGLVLPPVAVPSLVPAVGRGTLGGLYGDPRETPLTPAWGRTRDAALGVEAVRGDGTPFQAGGRVVKNVTGYDLTRFLCGSRGRFAVITRVHWRALPRPAVVEGHDIPFASDAALWDGLDGLRRAPVEPLAVAVDPGSRRVTVIEGGREESTRARLGHITTALGAKGSPVDPTTPLPGFELDREQGPPLVRIQLPYSRWREIESAAIARLQWKVWYPFAHFGFATVGGEITPTTGTEIAAWARSHGGSASWEWLARGTGEHLELEPCSPAARRLEDALQREWDAARTLARRTRDES